MMKILLRLLKRPNVFTSIDYLFIFLGGGPQQLHGPSQEKAEPSRNINGVLQDSPNKLINGGEPGTREDFLNDAGLKDFDLGDLKGEEEGEYKENKEQSKSLSNDEARQCKKSTDFVSNRGSDLDDLGVKEEYLSSDFTSPYCGSDKYCLDLLGIFLKARGYLLNNVIDEDQVDLEFNVAEDETGLKRRSFTVLEKDFTFGNEYSPNKLQKKNTFDDLSSSSMFDMEIEFSDNRQGENKEINGEILKKEEEEAPTTSKEEENKDVTENKDPSLEFMSALDQIIKHLKASKEEEETVNGTRQVKEEGVHNQKSEIEPKRITNNSKTGQIFTIKHRRPGLGYNVYCDLAY